MILVVEADPARVVQWQSYHAACGPFCIAIEPAQALWVALEASLRAAIVNADLGPYDGVGVVRLLKQVLPNLYVQALARTPDHVVRALDQGADDVQSDPDIASLIEHLPVHPRLLLVRSG